MGFSSLCELSSRQRAALLAQQGHTPVPDTPHKDHCRLADLSLRAILLRTLSSLQAEVHPSVLTAMTRFDRTTVAHHPVMVLEDPL
jgi:hypothetical protein